MSLKTKTSHENGQIVPAYETEDLPAAIVEGLRVKGVGIIETKEAIRNRQERILVRLLRV